uniref:Uncharacterized protein n=1 Tax=viral metagenome TaxID=1070528 RepID=A0A6C0LIK7_9ZZZZ
MSSTDNILYLKNALERVALLKEYDNIDHKNILSGLLHELYHYPLKVWSIELHNIMIYVIEHSIEIFRLVNIDIESYYNVTNRTDQCDKFIEVIKEIYKITKDKIDNISNYYLKEKYIAYQNECYKNILDISQDNNYIFYHIVNIAICFSIDKNKKYYFNYFLNKTINYTKKFYMSIFIDSQYWLKLY